MVVDLTGFEPALLACQRRRATINTTGPGPPAILYQQKDPLKRDHFVDTQVVPEVFKHAAVI